DLWLDPIVSWWPVQFGLWFPSAAAAAFVIAIRVPFVDRCGRDDKPRRLSRRSVPFNGLNGLLLLGLPAPLAPVFIVPILRAHPLRFLKSIHLSFDFSLSPSVLVVVCV